MQARRRTTTRSPTRWRNWATSTSMTRSRRRIAPTPRPRGWRVACLRRRGRLMEAELTALEKALGKPERPVVAVVGGAKVSTKLDLLGNLVTRVNYLVIGGGMANTFLAAQGIDVGKSLAEHDMAGTAREIMQKAEADGLRDRPARRRRRRAGVQGRRRDQDGCGRRLSGRRDDPRRRAADASSASRPSSTTARTLIWNGPLGAFEIPPFDAATNAAAAKAAELTEGGPPDLGRGRRRHRRRAEQGRRGGRLHLRLRRGRRLPRMDGGQDPPGRRRAAIDE